MTRIPSGIIKASIKLGSVYYFLDERLKSLQKHYMVVLNKNPNTDEVILFVCGQSKIQNIKSFRSNCPPATLVIITPKQYSRFSVDTIFDCNNVFPQSIDNIVYKYEKKELFVEPEINARLVELLRQGVMASRLIEPRFKEILR